MSTYISRPIDDTLSDVFINLYPLFHIKIGVRGFVMIPKRKEMVFSRDFWYCEIVDGNLYDADDENLQADLYHIYLRVLNTKNDFPIIKRTQGEVHGYWKSTTDDLNNPTSYITDNGRSMFLAGLLEKYLPDRSVSVLEIGCNVGRNLNACLKAGYHNLTGIEISAKALELMPNAFPELAKYAITYCCAIEDIIRNINPKAYDVVYTMATLEHLPLQSEWVFEQIERITKQYLITIEDEENVSYRHFPRNYKAIFDNHGLEQVEEIPSKMIANNELGDGFVARVFNRKQGGFH